jgi:hypothetical protein
VDLDIEEDFLSYAQREKETLPNFYQRFLQLKAQAPEVFDDQVIAQAIKALRVGPLHNHLVREQPNIVPELYEQFAKFNKSKILHFHKLEQQRKVSKPDKATRPHYNDNQHNYPRPMHNINSDGCGPLKNWEKNFGPSSQERNPRIFDRRSPPYTQRSRAPNRGHAHSRGPYTVKPLYCLYHESETNHHTIDCPIFLKTKQKMEQEPTQPSHQPPLKGVNHTMQWTPNRQQYSPSYPTLFHLKHTKATKPNLRHTINHTTTPQPTIPHLRQPHR